MRRAREVLYAYGVEALVTVIFYAAYATTDAVAHAHGRTVPVHFAWELGLPFVPQALFAYVSLYLLFLLAPWRLPDRAAVHALAAVIVAQTLVASVFFLILPARVAYAPVALSGWSALVLQQVEAAVLSHNLFPSLHVAFAVTCASVYARGARAGVRGLFAAWALVIAASTMLTHQHHLLDVLGGGALGWYGASVWYPRWLTRAASGGADEHGNSRSAAADHRRLGA